MRNFIAKLQHQRVQTITKSRLFLKVGCCIAYSAFAKSQVNYSFDFDANYRTIC